ncbi:MAG: lysylphosphatidylglycerol synthase domain-containing protein [Alphaproteobacteria bacterium]
MTEIPDKAAKATQQAAAAGQRRGRFGQIAVSALVTVGFLAVAWLLLDVGVVAEALLRVDVRLVPLALAAATGVVLLRWLRLAAALHRRPSLVLLRAAALHGGAVAILPAKLGEFILPLALNRMTGMSLAAAAGLLLVIRLYDLMSLAVLGALALALAAEPLGLAWLRWPAALAALAAGVVMVTLPVLARLVRSVLTRPLRRWRRLHDIFERLSLGMTKLAPAQIAAMILVSTAVWCAIFLAFHIAALATGGAADPATTVLAGTAGSLAFALPVNGVANVGPFEAAWAAVMTRAGVSLEVATAGALAAHALMIAVNVAAAALALLFGGIKRSA